jgi:hypothetical protein
MDFSLSVEQQSICAAIAKTCARFPDEYWLAKDREGSFRTTFIAPSPLTVGSALPSRRPMAVPASVLPKPP